MAKRKITRLPKYLTHDPVGSAKWEMASRRSLQLLRKGRYVAGMLAAKDESEKAMDAAMGRKP